MGDGEQTLTIALLSGTDEKLNAAALLTAGAAALGLQAEGGGQHWSTVLAQAKQLGEVRVHACSLSMDLLGLAKDDLDPLVDDVEGVTVFMLAADGQLVFI